MPLPVGSISYSIHRANAKKEAQTLAIRSQAHHKPNILWEKSAPLWARSQCIFFCSYLFEVVIRERLSKYVCIPRCRCKCTQNNSKIIDNCKITIFWTSFLTFPMTMTLSSLYIVYIINYIVLINISRIYVYIPTLAIFTLYGFGFIDCE